MKKVLKISGLDCPVCAEALQGDIRKIKGIDDVRVDYVSQTITLETESEEAIKKAIKVANAFEEVKVLDGGMYAANEENHAKAWWQIGVSALLFIVGFSLELLVAAPFIRWIIYFLYGAAYIAVGYPVLISTVKNVCRGRIFDENFLMTVASLGAVALGEYSEGVAVILLYQLGELLQSIAVGSSRKSVAELMKLKCERAVLLVDGEQKEVSPESLAIGDTVLVKAGEKAPADGVLLEERAVLDKKSLTGEAEPYTAYKGEEILSGSINVGNAYQMQITRKYEESAVGRILDMVENASAGKAEPEKFIAKFSRYYTPVVCILALLLALAAPLIAGLAVDGRLYFRDLPRWVNSALTFLVISCPCALVISVPLTYFSGIGRCAKKGILVKGATYLDTLAQVDIFAFDKTGTLTTGDFTVRTVKSVNGATNEEVLGLVASLEQDSVHPIAKAFANIEVCEKGECVEEVVGEGLIGKVNGETVLVGNEKLLLDHGVFVEEERSAYTRVFVARAGRYLGYVEIGDCVKTEAKKALSQLKRMGICRQVMLTGDNKIRAQEIANEVGMYEVNAQLYPDEKLLKVEELKGTGKVAYVGDGINDAPVMTAADCALSMGKIGSAAAVEAADVVLIKDDLTGAAEAVKIARKTRRIVLQNILFSIGMKVAFMALGALGILPLWLAVFADVGVMLLAVLNSFRVRI